MTEATSSKLNNPGKRLLIPVLKPYEQSTEQFTPRLRGEYEGLGYGNQINATSTTSSTPGKMFWVEMVDDGGKWDHPEAVKIFNEPVTALVSSTSKHNLHSCVKLGNLSVTVGEAEKIKSMLGEDTLQAKLAARPITQQQPESTMSTQLFKDKDSGQLFWRKTTNSFLGVRHEGLDPITFNHSLPKAKSKLQLITTIGPGRLPVILEESNSKLNITEQYILTATHCHQ